MVDKRKTLDMAKLLTLLLSPAGHEAAYSGGSCKCGCEGLTPRILEKRVRLLRSNYRPDHLLLLALLGTESSIAARPTQSILSCLYPSLKASIHNQYLSLLNRHHGDSRSHGSFCTDKCTEYQDPLGFGS